MSLLQTIWSKISAWFTKEKPIIEDALSKASNVVNILKTFISSPAGETIIAIIETFVPAASVDLVLNALATFFTDFGLVVAEAGKPFPEIIADGLAAINKLTGSSKILAWSNLAALIGKLFSDINGGNSTLQQHIVANQLVYNPDVLNSPAPDTVGNAIIA